jgi:formiminoglutamate deiminase
VRVSRWYARYAWVGHVAERVLIETDGQRISAVTVDTDPPADAYRLPGFVLPGLANVHSHAFHRALRARTDAGQGTFWAWREQMYAVAARLDPESYYALARATFAEMALAGVTAVGEFHYLHHDPKGRPYGQPNAMGESLVEAAADAGIRVTLIDVCYLRGGFDRPVDGPQVRFSDGDPQRWADRASDAPSAAHVLRGAAIHSVRAVPADAMAVVRDWAAERDAPLHVHVSEQPAENEACVAATGRTPTELLAEHGVLGRRTTAVHATHLSGADIRLVGDSATRTCLCPTTERNLADGIGPAAALRDAGSPLCVGSDSHAVIDLFEELRAIELNERLASLRRGTHRPEDLLAAATTSGMAALGWDAGALAPGRLADLVAVAVDGPRLAGVDPDHLPAAVVFAATAADVTHVVADGRPVVIDGRHVSVPDVGWALDQSIKAVSA